MSNILKPASIMGVFLGFLIFAVFSIGPTLVDIFYHNYLLNIFILSLFIGGIALSFFQLYKLYFEYELIHKLETNNFIPPSNTRSFVLVPLLMALKNQPLKSLNVISIKSILSSIDQRLENIREYNKYLTGLCVFLGLVGTFWGLSKTITAIATVINGIDINATDIKDAFQNLKSGLQSPLTGMGYAFSSSLFGLTASLALSFLDLQVSKAFGQFFNHLEDTIALVGKESNSGAHGPAYSNALIEQLSESMNAFQSQLDRAEDSRFQTSKLMHAFLTGLTQLESSLKINAAHIEKLIQQQLELQQNFSHHINQLKDDPIKETLKKIDINSQNILVELSQGREKTTQEIRQEIRLVSKTISALANGQDVT
jgi:hypothetical protein